MSAISLLVNQPAWRRRGEAHCDRRRRQHDRCRRHRDHEDLRWNP